MIADTIIEIYLIGFIVIVGVGSAVGGVRLVLVQHSEPMAAIGISLMIGMLWPLFVICTPLVGLGSLIGNVILAYRIWKRREKEKQDGQACGTEKAGNEPKW